MPATFRRWLYLLTLLSWLSGLSFFALSTWGSIEGEFGPQKHPLQFPVLMLHGAAAFCMMMTFGALLATHVPSSWRSKRLRGLGLSLTFVVGFQIVSAWLLYYLSSELWREWTAWAHLAVGGSLPFLIAAHLVRGYKTRTAAQGLRAAAQQ